MNASESRATASLALLFAIRMLGLFILLPVLSVLAGDLSDASPTLIGLAIGVYGLTQALFQIPFGILSDKYGRRPFILLGLALFIVGSLIAAMSTSIYGVIIGRALQGSGAIGGVITAFLTDLTRPETRTKAMAMIGASIGCAFLLALVAGPILGALIGLQGLFLAVGGLGSIGLIVAMTTLPKEAECLHKIASIPSPGLILKSITHPQLFRMFLGVMLLHLVQTNLFVALPQLLVITHQFEIAEHWRLYLPTMLISFVLIVPLIIAGEKRGAARSLVLAMILLLLLSCAVILSNYQSFTFLTAGLFLFFAGFNALEALMPSTVSRLAPAGQRGLCMSTYSTFQFFGAFLGGALGGIIYGTYDFGGVILLNIVALGLWLLITLGMAITANLKTITIYTDDMEPDQDKLSKLLLGLPGVREVNISKEDHIAHLKVDQKLFDNSFLQDLRLFKSDTSQV